MSPARVTLISQDGRCSASLLPQPAGRTAPLLACISGGGCNGRYFEVMAPSVAALAHARGHAVLLLDRPGYGGSEPIAGGRPIRDSLPRIRSLLAVALARAGASDLLLVGHSIGGAVALMLAAAPEGLPLAAVAVSGIGDEPPHATQAWSASLDGPAPPPDFGADLFFAPPGSYSWRGPAALRRATEPWRMTEVVEIVERWPREWPALAARIKLPVHLRLADHDGIWRTGEAVVRRMASRLTRSPLVDAALLPDGGHAYEFHRRGPELIAAQLDFLDQVIAGRRAASASMSE